PGGGGSTAFRQLAGAAVRCDPALFGGGFGDGSSLGTLGLLLGLGLAQPLAGAVFFACAGVVYWLLCRRCLRLCGNSRSAASAFFSPPLVAHLSVGNGYLRLWCVLYLPHA